MSKGKLEHATTSWTGQALKHDARLDHMAAHHRVLFVLAFALVVVTLTNLIALIGAVLIGIVLVIYYRLPWRKISRRLLAMDFFMLLLLIFLPFTVKGTPFASIAGLTMSEEGLIKAAQIILRANAITLMALSLLATLNAARLGQALLRLRVPQKFVLLLLFMVRYLDVITKEYKRMNRSLKARSFRFKANRHSWRTQGYLIGMMLLRSYDRAERTQKAMRCRGFNGHFPVLTPEPQSTDVHTLSILVLASMALIVMNTVGQ